MRAAAISASWAYAAESGTEPPRALCTPELEVRSIAPDITAKVCVVNLRNPQERARSLPPRRIAKPALFSQGVEILSTGVREPSFWQFLHLCIVLAIRSCAFPIVRDIFTVFNALNPK